MVHPITDQSNCIKAVQKISRIVQSLIALSWLGGKIARIKANDRDNHHSYTLLVTWTPVALPRLLDISIMITMTMLLITASPSCQS